MRQIVLTVVFVVAIHGIDGRVFSGEEVAAADKIDVATVDYFDADFTMRDGRAAAAATTPPTASPGHVLESYFNPNGAFGYTLGSYLPGQQGGYYPGYGKYPGYGGYAGYGGYPGYGGYAGYGAYPGYGGYAGYGGYRGYGVPRYY